MAWLRFGIAGRVSVCGHGLACVRSGIRIPGRQVPQVRHPGRRFRANLEAAIPDAAALVFACLGVALALHGRRAIRVRALNVALVGASVFMNVIAAGPRWRSLAVWAMPPLAYALASDTLIGVVRSWVIARHKHPNVTLAHVVTQSPPGSWPWSPNATVRRPRCRWTTWRRSALLSRSRTGHPDGQPPRLTIRMGAATGLSDTLGFSGGKTAAYRQAGNAFPPPLVRAGHADRPPHCQAIMHATERRPAGIAPPSS
jgi:hypothetical protein